MFFMLNLINARVNWSFENPLMSTSVTWSFDWTCPTLPWWNVDHAKYVWCDELAVDSWKCWWQPYYHNTSNHWSSVGACAFSFFHASVLDLANIIWHEKIISQKDTLSFDWIFYHPEIFAWTAFMYPSVLKQYLPEQKISNGDICFLVLGSQHKDYINSYGRREKRRRETWDLSALIHEEKMLDWGLLHVGASL